MPTNRLVVKEKVATYALALFDGTLATGGQDAVFEVRDEMERVIRFIRSNMDLSVALSDSSYTPEQRNEIAQSVFSGFNPVLVDVLAVMAERVDIALLQRVLGRYEDMIETKLNISLVDITTVVPLDDKLRKLVTEKTEFDLGKTVVLREHIDEAILGGIIMSANGKRIDASVLSQLESARSVLKTTRDGGEARD